MTNDQAEPGVYPSESECYRAFNLGSDARIAGRSMQANPYPFQNNDSTLRDWWRRGWTDANKFWGSWNKYAKPLREVVR